MKIFPFLSLSFYFLYIGAYEKYNISDPMEWDFNTKF